MNKFLKSTLSVDGVISSKRFITLLSFTLMALGFLGNLFFDLTIEQYIYESMQWIVMVGIGATASEQFSKYMVSRGDKKMKSVAKEEPYDDGGGEYEYEENE